VYLLTLAFYYRDTYHNTPPMTVEQLAPLKSIKEITEYLMVQNLNGFNVTSLSFLSNLEKILGQTKDTYVHTSSVTVFLVSIVVVFIIVVAAGVVFGPAV